MSNSGIKGGELKGKAHSECDENGCGIKATINGDKTVWLQGKELIVNADAAQDPEVITVTGTKKQIASAINSDKGFGVEIEPGAKVERTGEVKSENPQSNKSHINTTFKDGGEIPEKKIRFEAGKKLNSEEKKEIYKSLRDSYKIKNRPYDIDQNDKKVWLDNASDYMIQSDITGRLLRWYITLPDNRIAHPTEVYGVAMPVSEVVRVQNNIEYHDRQSELRYNVVVKKLQEKGDVENVVDALKTALENGASFNETFGSDDIAQKEPYTQLRFAHGGIRSVPDYVITLKDSYLGLTQKDLVSYRIGESKAREFNHVMSDIDWRRFYNEFGSEEKFKDGGEIEDLGNQKNNRNITENLTKDGLYNIISGKSEVSNGNLIQTASRFLRADKNSSKAGRDVQSDIEKNRLTDFADENNLWISFDLNEENFVTNGSEQRVYNDGTGLFVLKVNSSIYYDYLWSKYFDNLLIHNHYFPDTAYELIGFTKSPSGFAMPVVKQRLIVEDKKTDLKKVEKFLIHNGFEKSNPTMDVFKNKSLGITLSDLHEGNVLTQNEKLFFIDTKFFIDFEMQFKKGGEIIPNNQPMTEPINFPDKFSLEWYNELYKKVNNGEVSVSDFKEAFKYTVGKKEEILILLDGYTKDKLLNMVGGMSAYRLKSEKKDRVVSGVYSDLLGIFQLGTLSWSYTESFEVALERKVQTTTQEDLQKHADEVTKARVERKEQLEKFKKALENPETVAEFKIFIEKKGIAQLTPDQKRLYDSLVSENVLVNREKQIEQRAEISKVDGVSTEMKLIETVHTRDNYPLYVVQLGDRVEKETYNELNQKAKQLGGWYSSFRGKGAVAGFQFKEKSQAEKFMSLKEGDVSNIDKVEERIEQKEAKRADKLRENAESLIEKADEELNRERLTNTYKRANQAGASEDRAREQKRIGETMINIANAIDNGDAKYLNNISAKTHIELLDLLIRQAKRYEMNAKYPSEHERRQHEGEPATIETVDYLKHGLYPNIYGEHLKSLVAKSENRDGAKLIAARWRKKLARVKEYESFQITSENEIEEIKKMFYSLPESEQKYNRIDDDIKYFSRMKSMKIDNDSMLREVLREYIQYRGKKGEVDNVKLLERKLAGQGSSVGFDYFPTPKNTARQMVEMAQIKEGMSVLEPSAGNGNIAEIIREEGVTPDVIEISSTLREILEAKGFPVVAHDFETFNEKKYDRIIMNPPFSNSLDAKHIMHAYTLLNDGGRIVAIAGEGIFTRSDKKSVEFREWLDSLNAEVEKLEANTFQDKTLYSTTGANARLITIEKAEAMTNETNNELLKRIFNAQSSKSEGGFFPEFDSKKATWYLVKGENNTYIHRKSSSNDVSDQYYTYAGDSFDYKGSYTALNGIKNKEIKLSKADFEGTEFVSFLGKKQDKPENELPKRKSFNPEEFYQNIPKEGAKEIAQYWGNRKYLFNTKQAELTKDELDEMVEYQIMIDKYHPEFNEWFKKSQLEREKDELAKGKRIETEHIDTLKKVASGEVSPEQGVTEIAKDHIDESPVYYDELEKMEENLSNDTYPIVKTDDDREGITQWEFDVNTVNESFHHKLIGQIEKQDDEYYGFYVNEMYDENYYEKTFKTYEEAEAWVLSKIKKDRDDYIIDFGKNRGATKEVEHEEKLTPEVLFEEKNDLQMSSEVEPKAEKTEEMKKTNLGSDDWSKIPLANKYVTKVVSKAYTYDPYDKVFQGITDKFTGKDPLRPVFSGVNFSEKGIAVTDAHVLLYMNEVSKKYNGTYCVSSKCIKTVGMSADLKEEKIDVAYPKYEVVIPTDNPYVYDVDLLSIKTYCETIIRSGYVNKNTNTIKFVFDGDKIIGISGKLLIEAIEGFMTMGYQNVKVGLSARNKAITFVADLSYDGTDSPIGKSDFFLSMPAMIYGDSDEFNYQTIQGDEDLDTVVNCVYSFEKDGVLTKGGEVFHKIDTSLTKEKAKDSGEVSAKDIQIASQFLKATKSILPILENVKVKNNEMTLDNLEMTYTVSGINMPDGIYSIRGNSLFKEKYDLDDFPIERVTTVDKGDINRQEFLYQLERCLDFVGKDELRPVMQGVHLFKDTQGSGDLIIEATDAHALYRAKIEKHNIEGDFDIIIGSPKLAYKILQSFECDDIDIFLSDDKFEYIKFVCGTGRLSSRLVDGKYPVTHSVYPNRFDKKITFANNDLKKIEREIKAEAKKASKKLDATNAYFILNNEPTGKYIISHSEYINRERITTVLKEGEVNFSIVKGEFDLWSTGINIPLIMPVLARDEDETTTTGLSSFNLERLTGLGYEKVELGVGEPQKAILVLNQSKIAGTVVTKKQAVTISRKKEEAEAERIESENQARIIAEEKAKLPKHYQQMDGIEVGQDYNHSMYGFVKVIDIEEKIGDKKVPYMVQFVTDRGGAVTDDSDGSGIEMQGISGFKKSIIAGKQLSDLAGKHLHIYTLGEPDPIITTVDKAEVSFPEYLKRDITLFSGNAEEKIPLAKLNDLFSGAEIELKDSKGEPYVIVLSDEMRVDEPEPVEDEAEAIRATIEGLELIIDDAKAKEKKAMQATIDGLKLLLEDMPDGKTNEFLHVYDEGMYNGREIKIMEEQPTLYVVAYINHEGDSIKLHGVNFILKEDLEKSFSKFPTNQIPDKVALKFKWRREKSEEQFGKGGEVKSDNEKTYIITGGGFAEKVEISAKDKAEAISKAQEMLRPIFGHTKKKSFKVALKKSDVYEQGGEIESDDDDEEDLFENYEALPENVREVLNRYSTDDNDYESLKQMEAELEPLGYTFEYGLDAVPYGLKKIYAKGGEVPSKDAFKVGDLVNDEFLGYGKVLSVNPDSYDVIFWDKNRKNYLITSVNKKPVTMVLKTGKFYDSTGQSFDGKALFTESRLDYLQNREDHDILTKEENQEYESLVEKYRKTSKYKSNKDVPKKLNGYFVNIYSNGTPSESNIVSTKVKRVILVTDGIKGDSFSVQSDEPYIKLVKREIGGKEYLSAEPVNFGAEGKHKMFGGCFVWSSDSRFRNEVSEKPVALHDRVEYEKGGEIDGSKLEWFESSLGGQKAYYKRGTIGKSDDGTFTAKVGYGTNVYNFETLDKAMKWVDYRTAELDSIQMGEELDDETDPKRKEILRKRISEADSIVSKYEHGEQFGLGGEINLENNEPVAELK